MATFRPFVRTYLKRNYARVQKEATHVTATVSINKAAGMQKARRGLTRSGMLTPSGSFCLLLLLLFVSLLVMSIATLTLDFTLHTHNPAN